MPNPTEPERDGTASGNPGAGVTEGQPRVPTDSETETLAIPKGEPATMPVAAPLASPDLAPERRFTAPGFDEKETAVIATAPEPATEVFQTQPVSNSLAPPPPPSALPKTAVPQSIPARGGVKQQPPAKHRSWGWVLAIVVAVLALVAIAIFGVVLMQKRTEAKVSKEDQVRQTIQGFDTAIQRGDLTALRRITCGATKDSYVEYDEKSWAETYSRVSAAKQYPVIASIDQIVVNGQHAEANITTFMAYDPQVSSTRSLDLQFRDDQWKICQSPTS